MVQFIILHILMLTISYIFFTNSQTKWMKHWNAKQNGKQFIEHTVNYG